MLTVYEDRVIFCSDKSDCVNCEFIWKCCVIPEKEIRRVIKCKIAAVYGSSVDEKTTVS